MRKRRLGRTGLEVSEIAFGGVEIGMPYGIGVESRDDMLAENEAIDLLHAAVDAGINFFDTARAYGNSEHIMGKAFKGRRDNIVICTKCNHFQRTGGRLPGKKQLVKTIEESIRESLRALQTDYADVFMLHTGDLDVLDNDEIAGAFSALKQAGAARSVGVSVYLPEETEKAVDMGIWDVIQLPFNLMDQSQASFFQAASRKDIALVIRSVLLKGLLSERGRDLHPALKKVEDHIAGYNKLLHKDIGSLPALATKFALSFDEVSAILVGIDRVEYLRQSLASADGRYLDEVQLRQARAMAYPDPAFLNLHEWSKKGWLK